jgi:hypothetical protein
LLASVTARGSIVRGTLWSCNRSQRLERQPEQQRQPDTLPATPVPAPSISAAQQSLSPSREPLSTQDRGHTYFPGSTASGRELKTTGNPLYGPPVVSASPVPFRGYPIGSTLGGLSSFAPNSQRGLDSRPSSSLDSDSVSGPAPVSPVVSSRAHGSPYHPPASLNRGCPGEAPQGLHPYPVSPCPSWREGGAEIGGAGEGAKGLYEGLPLSASSSGSTRSAVSWAILT